METIDFRLLHLRALELTTGVVDQVGPEDAARPTPCPPWDLSALLSHMIGQNYGFAAAVSSETDVPLTAFAPRAPGQRPARDWATSAQVLAGAFAGCDLERPVLLAEISEEQRFPAWMAIGFQLLDTVVHCWDVATAVEVAYQPDGELATATLRLAQLVPAGPTREQSGAAFAPVRPLADGAGEWSRALALLGRDPAAETLPGRERTEAATRLG
jgi:uncharacterized protein (TIGR03086 family)